MARLVLLLLHDFPDPGKSHRFPCSSPPSDTKTGEKSPKRTPLAEQNDEWTESRRYMGLEILAACRKAAQPDVGQNDISEAGLTIEAIPA